MEHEKLMIGGVDMWGNMMATQSLLDARISRDHGIKFKECKEERILALVDEMMEFAKETKCFKYWSRKEPSSEAVRLEEFVDGIHFYLSKFNELHGDPLEIIEASNSREKMKRPLNNPNVKKLVTYEILRAIHYLIQSKDRHGADERMQLLHSFSHFMAAGRLNGFTDLDIEKMYYIKNRKNQDRQDQGY